MQRIECSECGQMVYPVECDSGIGFNDFGGNVAYDDGEYIGTACCEAPLTAGQIKTLEDI